MMFSARFSVLVLTGLLAGAQASADNLAPTTANVLGKLHAANVKEMRMGSLAIEHGRSKELRGFGRTLVDDHDAMDTLVADLAKKEQIVLAANTPPVGPSDVPPGARFDRLFALSMMNDHRKDLSEAKAARAATHDEQLRSLLDALIPVMQTHLAIAEQLLDQTS